MKIQIKALLLSTAIAALMLPVAAQAANGPAIHQRKVHQQRRIGQGVRSGQLTPRETIRLEKRERHINRETRRMRAANGGPLSPAQKAKVTRQQNRVSRSIYRQKHDAQHR